MIKVVSGKFEYHSISPKIRQILLHWGFELTENDLLGLSFALLEKYFINFFQMKCHYSYSPVV